MDLILKLNIRLNDNAYHLNKQVVFEDSRDLCPARKILATAIGKGDMAFFGPVIILSAHCSSTYHHNRVKQYRYNAPEVIRLSKVWGYDEVLVRGFCCCSFNRL
jgi:purine nucleoside permease